MQKNPRVVGVKNSSMPVYDIEGFRRAFDRECILFNGPDEQFVAGRAIGADGGIGGTYAVMPELFLKMDALCRANDFAAAAPIQHSVNTIIEAMCACRGNLYAVIKKIIELREGLPLGGVRPPMPNLEAEDMAQVHVCAEMIDAAIKSFA